MALAATRSPFGAAWFIARSDVAHMLRRRETLAWIFVMPILFFYFIGTVTGGLAPRSGDGRDALAKLAGRTYDLILSDLRMPELDGPGLYREVERRRPELCCRFIFLTGDTLSPEAQEFLEQTSVPSLAKPFAFDEVRHVVRDVLARIG